MCNNHAPPCIKVLSMDTCLSTNLPLSSSGVNTFLQDTVEDCRARGYVETMMGRRRYLPAISSNNAASRGMIFINSWMLFPWLGWWNVSWNLAVFSAHAERQAVNTTVQGSAADLTKAAMIAVDREITKMFSDCTIYSSDSTSNGAYLVLQLHDELLYEVSSLPTSPWFNENVRGRIFHVFHFSSLNWDSGGRRKQPDASNWLP